jgi:DNA-binding XRE family transcriptional regulator
MDGILITGTNSEDFLNRIRQISLEAAKEAIKEKSKEDLLTQEEAASYLDISKTTIIKWGKRHIVTPIEMGGRVYYDRLQIHNKKKEKG